jgi:HEAT repeat protein
MRRSVRVRLIPLLIIPLALAIHTSSARASMRAIFPGYEWGSILRADAVFLGRVVSQTNIDLPRRPSSVSPPMWTFAVEHLWKGPPADTLTVFGSDRAVIGQTWVVFAVSRYGKLQMMDADSRPVAESGGMLRALAGLPATGSADVVDLALLDMFAAGLRDTSERVRVESARHLVHFDLYADRVVPLLEAAIDTDVAAVGAVAIHALSQLQIRGDRPIRSFCRAYEKPPLRVSAIRALSRYHYRQDVLHPLFLRAVRDTSAEVRSVALEFLQEEDDSLSGLVPEFLALLADPEARVREAALKKTWVLSKAKVPVIPALLDVTQDPDPWVRREAMNEIFYDFPEEAEPLMRRALDDPVPEMRRTVLSLLAQEDAPDRLRDFAIDRGFDDNDPVVRYWATELLFVGSSIGAKQRQQRIERAFADWRPEVWEALCQNVCGSRGVESVSDHVRERLLTRVIAMAERGVPATRVAAFRILNCWGVVPDHIPLFDRALVSPYEEVRMEAIRGLSRAGAGAAPALPRLRALAVGSSRQAEYARKAIESIEAAMIRP